MTIKDLSAYTGYSVGTISRVLNNQPNVSEKARAAILRAAAEQGYQLNVNAKQLKQQRGNAVLMMVKGTSSELLRGLAEAIRERMAQTSYPLILDYVEEGSNEVQRAAQLCLEKKPLGVLFLGGCRESFRTGFDRIQVPCVLVTNDAAGLDFPNLSSVCSDDTFAAQMAVEQLIRLGHRKIAVLGGSDDAHRSRFRGCMNAFREHGLEFDPVQRYETAGSTFADGYRAASRLLERKADFSALFALSDEVAIGAIRALEDAGLGVPRDVSVMGFGGLALGDYTVPRLSTLRQNVTEMAERSIQLLLASIEEQTGPRFLTVPVTLEEKESTRQI